MKPKTYTSAAKAIRAFFDTKKPVAIENGSYRATLSLYPSAEEPKAIHVEVRTGCVRLLTVFPIVAPPQLHPAAVVDGLVANTFQEAFELDSKALQGPFNSVGGHA